MNMPAVGSETAALSIPYKSSHGGKSVLSNHTVKKGNRGFCLAFAKSGFFFLAPW